mmetsp:Transcript_82643/g.188876  ORF Transcript_82643/g.188876 Transcript_82643/m.188876 type:complete len:231 (-) Transcript_82643:43-735(-)
MHDVRRRTSSCRPPDSSSTSTSASPLLSARRHTPQPGQENPASSWLHRAKLVTARRFWLPRCLLELPLLPSLALHRRRLAFGTRRPYRPRSHRGSADDAHHPAGPAPWSRRAKLMSAARISAVCALSLALPAAISSRTLSSRSVASHTWPLASAGSTSSSRNLIRDTLAHRLTTPRCSLARAWKDTASTPPQAGRRRTRRQAANTTPRPGPAARDTSSATPATTDDGRPA